MLKDKIIKFLRFIHVLHTPETPEQYLRIVGARVGQNCCFVDFPNFGSEPYLISIGEKTTISFGVAFVTHDASTRVIRNLPGKNPETGLFGKILIGNNCFIGCRSTILPNVTIGDNTIIGACSLVNRDIPANSVAAGNPCRVICSLEEYIAKHESDFLYMNSLPYEEKKAYLQRLFDE